MRFDIQLVPAADRLEFRTVATLPLSEVEARLSEIAEDVATTHEHVGSASRAKEAVA